MIGTSSPVFPLDSVAEFLPGNNADIPRGTRNHFFETAGVIALLPSQLLHVDGGKKRGNDVEPNRPTINDRH